MNKVGRTLSAAATTIGLVVGATGCASNVIGSDGPRPGIAAQVEDSEITLDELGKVTDGLCTLQEANPEAPTTSRAYAQSAILQAWVLSLVRAEYVEEHDLEVTTPDPGLNQTPGWDDVDEDDREALTAYVEAFLYSEGAMTAMQEAEVEGPDAADYDIVINPRFDLELDGAEFVPAGDQLSVPVSEEGALVTAAPDDAALQELSDAELCGNRPDPDVAPPPVPMG